MTIFSSAHLALRRSLAAVPRAASLGVGLRQASDGYVMRMLLHGQILPRWFTSDAFGLSRNFPPSGRDRFNFVRPDLHSNTQANFNNADNGGTMSKTAGGERGTNLGRYSQFAASRMFTEREQYSKNKKRDFVHILMKRKKTFVTVTDASCNKKTGASAGCLEGRKGQRMSRYAAEATAEHVGRAAKKMGLRSVVMKVKGSCFFQRKKKVILAFREGFRGTRLAERSPIVWIHDVTQLPHNGCRLPKRRRV